MFAAICFPRDSVLVVLVRAGLSRFKCVWKNILTDHCQLLQYEDCLLKLI